MTSQELIDSGIIELYCLGIATAEEHAAVEAIMRNDEEVRFEVEAINKSLSLYASQLIEGKSSSIKKKILDQITEGERIAPLRHDQAPACRAKSR